MPRTMHKILHPGRTPEGWPVFFKVEITAKVGGRLILSITGVEGPKRTGDCKGACGQIVDHEIADLAEGWTLEMLARLREVWRVWHLNDMRAGCEHQRAERWNERPINPDFPTASYGKHFEGQTSSSWNMLVCFTRKEHPEGLLGEPCPTCGYKYGTAWLHEELPEDVVEFLESLPKSTVTPAWV